MKKTSTRKRDRDVFESMFDKLATPEEKQFARSILGDQIERIAIYKRNIVLTDLERMAYLADGGTLLARILSYLSDEDLRSACFTSRAIQGECANATASLSGAIGVSCL